MFYVFITIFFISLIIAFRSMADFEVPKEIKKLLAAKKIKGTIVFFKDKIRHY